MKLRNTTPALGIAIVAFVALAAVRQSSPREVSDILLRFNGPVRIAADDTASTVVVFGHDAVVEGTVREQLVVIGGTADVDGTVLGNLVVVNGRAALGPEAVVGENVVLHESVLEREPGARVGGVVRESEGFEPGPIIGWLFWFGMTVIVLVVGLLFAAVAGGQLSDAAARIGEKPGPVVLTALLVVIGLPALALLSFVTVIGIPLGFLIAFVLIPLLALLGYIVTATWIGAAIVRRWGDPRRAEQRTAHPYLAVLAGILVLHLVGLIPVIGMLIMGLACQLGAGALLYRLWRVMRRERAA